LEAASIGGAVSKEYIPGVEKGINSSMDFRVLGGLARSSTSKLR